VNKLSLYRREMSLSSTRREKRKKMSLNFLVRNKSRKKKGARSGYRKSGIDYGGQGKGEERICDVNARDKRGGGGKLPIENADTNRGEKGRDDQTSFG